MDWMPIITKTKHFHLGSYSFTEGKRQIAIDTHDQPISEDTILYLREIAPAININNATLILERDHNLSTSDWVTDVNKLNGVFQ